MYLSRARALPAALIFNLCFLLLSACSSGGGGGTSGPTLPDDAATISDSNADGIASAAVGMMDVISVSLDPSAPVSGATPSTATAIQAMKNKLLVRTNDGDAIPAGVVETDPCIEGGSISDNYSAGSGTASGTMTLSNCGIGNNLLANGSISYEVSGNDNTGDFTISADGSINYSGASNFRLVLDVTISGNDYNGDFSSNLDYSVSGYPGGGFLVDTTQNFVGNDYDGSVNSGQMIIHGAGNSQLRITITSPNVASLELDTGNGSFAARGSIALTDNGIIDVVDSGPAVPSLPGDAVVITTSNAAEIASAAVTARNLSGFNPVMAVESTGLPPMRELINAVTARVFDRNKHSFATVAGVTYTETCPGSGGGTFTDIFNETAGSMSGVYVFVNCDLIEMTVSGTFNYSVNWDNVTGDYSQTANGNLSYSQITGLGGFEMALNLTETGNDISGDYSTNLSYAVSSLPGGGFLVTTQQNLVGNFNSFETTGGVLIVYGANNTRLRITVTGTNTASIDVDEGGGMFGDFGTIDL